MTSSWDFALLDRVLVRLVGADDRQLGAARRHLGEPAPASDREADLTVRFRPRLEAGDRLRRVGEDAGYDRDTFYVVRRAEGRARLVALPLADLARGMTVDCDASIVDVPHLVSLVNVTALGRGLLPLHASAFVVDGVGIAAAGWSKGGKTEALLAMTAGGADPLADEWCYVDPATRLACGLPSPIRLDPNHLRQDRSLRRFAGRGRRLRMSVLARAGRGYRTAAGRLDGVPGVRWGHRLLPIVDGMTTVDVDARRLYGDPPFRPHRLDRVIMVVASERRRTASLPIAAGDLVERMVAAHMHHRRSLLALYDAYRFAFPDAPSALLDGLAERERELLTLVIGDEPSIAVEHPHPAELGALRRVLRTALARAG